MSEVIKIEKVDGCVTKTMEIDRDTGTIAVTTVTPFWENVPEEYRIKIGEVRDRGTYYRSQVERLKATLLDPSAFCRASVAVSKIEVNGRAAHLRKPCSNTPVGEADLCTLHGGPRKSTDVSKVAELEAENIRLKRRMMEAGLLSLTETKELLS